MEIVTKQQKIDLLESVFGESLLSNILYDDNNVESEQTLANAMGKY